MMQSEAPHPIYDWMPTHSLFAFPCRGSLFQVAQQVQQAFGFQPSLNVDMIAQRLNSQPLGLPLNTPSRREYYP
ncbi:hypothetical protein GJ744_008998 [Endocarpon pusillum]|uniref:Uncharacterized protein n=1 Tax=Endocarpon pusillum TaxID=364733 RepID=A0A8H7E6L2_9EURO|nr:hypothetical protein GJ744_008998 [Endocarpon pusillum]